MLDFERIVRLLEEEDWETIRNVVPELNRLDGLWQGIKYHYTDAWTHTQHVVKGVKLVRDKVEGKEVVLDFSPPRESGFYAFQSSDFFDPHVTKWLRETMDLRTRSGFKLWDVVLVAALFHDIGKPDTAEDVGDGIRVHFIGHPEIGADILKKMLNARALNDPWPMVLDLIRYHFLLLKGFSYNFPEKRFIPYVSGDNKFKAMLLVLNVADILSSKASHRFAEYMEYLGTVAWYWIYYERILHLKYDYFASTYTPAQYRSIKEAATMISLTPPNPYAINFGKISVQHHKEKVKLDREFSIFAEFSVRHPVEVVSMQGIKFLAGLARQLPHVYRRFSQKAEHNPLVADAVKAVDIAVGNRDIAECQSCLVLAIVLLCNLGDRESALKLTGSLESDAGVEKVIRYCGFIREVDRLNRVSAYLLGRALGFISPDRIEHWLVLPCNSLSFYIWDEIFEHMVGEMVSSPPFKAGMASGELQRLFLKLWECPNVSKQLSQYSTWVMKNITKSDTVFPDAETTNIIVNSIVEGFEADIVKWIHHKRRKLDVRLIVSMVRSDVSILLYINDTKLLRKILPFDIGRKARQLINSILDSRTPCERLRRLTAALDMKVEEIVSLDNLERVIMEMLDRLGLEDEIVDVETYSNAEKLKRLATKLPASARLTTLQCLNKIIHENKPMRNSNIIKRLSSLLIKKFL